MLTALPSPRLGHRLPSPLRLDADTPVPESRLDRVRGAAVAFVRGTTVGWGRRDLADWLVCQYAPCAALPLYPESPDLPPAVERTLDEGMIEGVILEARASALRLLGELVVPWQASPIARLAVASGTVISQRDARGAVAYSPVKLKRLRLSDRVASLFIADYLNRPSEYQWLMMCRECGELSFTDEIEHAPWCAASPEQWMAFTAAEAITRAAGL
jgi:hypothetical protein